MFPSKFARPKEEQKPTALSYLEMILGKHNERTKKVQQQTNAEIYNRASA